MIKLMNQSKSRIGIVLSAIVLVVLAVAFVFLAGGWNRAQAERAVAMPQRLSVYTVCLGELPPPEQMSDYRGTLHASKEAELSFRRSGRIQSIAVEEGDDVAENDVLAELDASDVLASITATKAQIDEATALLNELIAGPRLQTIAVAEADVARLESSLELAKITADRERRLNQSSASSQQAYDEARLLAAQQESALNAARQQLSELQAGSRTERVDAQRARVASLEAQLSVLEVQRSDCRIVAPFSGRIARRNVDEGTIAGAERVVLRLIQVDPLEARFGITPEDAAQIAIGQPVVVSVGATRLNGEAQRIEPELDLATRTQGLYVAISRAKNSLQNQGIKEFASVVPGQTCSLSLGRNAQNQIAADRLWLPIEGIGSPSRGLWTVFVVVKNSQGERVLERREVQILATESNRVLLGGGMIQAGDEVVCEALHRITAGMIVEPVKKQFSTAKATVSPLTQGVNQ